MSHADTNETEAFELRADYVDEESLIAETATNDFYDGVHRALINRNLTLIVGPRGCGKTHMMRYTWLRCREEITLPLAVYVNFNRYYRLEPLLKTKANAIQFFHTWVLARIVESINDTVLYFEKQKATTSTTEATINDHVADITGYEIENIKQLIVALECGVTLSGNASELASTISTEVVSDLLFNLGRLYSRSHTVLLLDDAALLLTPEYLGEFFDVVRSIKRTRVAPKASVYPGTTEYGPRFHAQHEADSKNVWLATEDDSYSATMQAVATFRYPAGLTGVSHPVNELFKLAAFGIPRAYLTLLRDYQSSSGSSRQQMINKIIDRHHEGRLEEYRSLSLKMPKLENLVDAGHTLFAASVQALAEANTALIETDEKQLMIGIYQKDISPMVSRMINLLVEAGLFYEIQSVSHGEGRQHKRFIPHMASLLAARAFSGKSRGFSPRQIVDFLNDRKQSKHAIRWRLDKLVPTVDIANLSLNLPPCQNCQAVRLNDSQRFCHSCGAKLYEVSTYQTCMSFPIGRVPGITNYQKTQLEQHSTVRTIGDLLAIQDPGTELRRIPYVGDVRARRIQDLVIKYVDEFLS